MKRNALNTEHLKQFQWLSMPSNLAILFVALTKGYDGMGVWLTLLLGEIVFVSVWYIIYIFTISQPAPNKKQYYHSTTIYQLLFIGVCIYYVLYI